MEIPRIVLDIFNIIFPSIGILSSISILFLIIYHRHRCPITIPVILISNTYLFIILMLFCLVDMSSHSLYGDLLENISLENQWCYIRAYVLHVELCSIYLSYVLQALFRLFRIVFYKYQRLQTFRFVLGLIIFQWILAFIIVTPSIPLGYFQYLPQNYYCHIPLTNLQGTLLISMTTYYGPTLASSTIYFYIMYQIKQRTRLATLQNRHRSMQRDVIVLRRIFILVGIFLVFLVPSMILWFSYFATDYLHPLIYHVEWLTISMSLSTVAIVSAIINPPIRQLFQLPLIHRHQQIRPAIVMQIPVTQVG